jgi:flavodoxin
MKILIVFYSRTGITKKVAETLQKELSCDIEEIISVKNRAGAIGWIISGKEGSGRELGEIKPTRKNPSEYDLVIVGTPVWVSMSSLLRTYLTKNANNFKNLAAFCTMGGNCGKTFGDIEDVCKTKLLATMAIREKDVKKGDISNKIKNFAQSLQF